jgi:hypothetical protein
LHTFHLATPFARAVRAGKGIAAASSQVEVKNRVTPASPGHFARAYGTVAGRRSRARIHQTELTEGCALTGPVALWQSACADDVLGNRTVNTGREFGQCRQMRV